MNIMNDNPNYRPDVICLQKIISLEEIQKTNEIIKNKQQDYLDLEDNPAPNVKKTSTVKFIRYEEVKNVLRKAFNCFTNLNREFYGFNIFPNNDLTILHHNTYTSKNNSEYELHEDRFAGDTKDIKLTAIINLSEVPYEGGEFIVYSNNEIRTISEISEPGSILLLRHGVFHGVKPVTKGERMTLTFWPEGPVFV